MKDLFNATERRRVIERLQKLQPESQPRWGSLTAPLLMAHLIDACRISFAEKAVEPQPGFLSTALGRWLALRMPIPRGRIKAPPAFHETEPEDFDSDRARVITYIERFADGPDQTWGPSPIFGQLSPQQWARLHRTHFDHHLRQFGV